MVAQRVGTNLQYVHQDHLSSTSLMTNSSGSQIGSTIKYRPFGETLSGSVPTDKLFTGQRLDDVTGLYFYNARYYDPTIGRFISPDTVIQSMADTQCLNRFSYALNNPLKYIDPSGHIVSINGIDDKAIQAAMNSGSYGQLGMFSLDPLRQAFNTLIYEAPKLASKLITAETVFSYEWSSVVGKGGVTAPDIMDINPNADVITLIGSDLKNEDTRSLFGVVAHESFHNMIVLEIGPAANYAANEVFAWAYGNSMAFSLGYDMGKLNPVSYQFLLVNPYSDIGSSNNMVEYCGKVLTDIGYNNRKPYRNLWPMAGQEKFLEVAQSYWPWGNPSPWSGVF
jgi:RHS repeat-associated protein